MKSAPPPVLYPRPEPRPTRRRLVSLLCVFLAVWLIGLGHPIYMLGGLLVSLGAVVGFGPDIERFSPSAASRIVRRIIGLVLIAIAATASRGGGFSDATVGALVLFVWVAAAVAFSPDLAEFTTHKVSAVFFPNYDASTPLSDYSLARAAAKAHDYERAARAYRDYAEADPDDQRVRLELAQLYRHELKDKPAAAYWYEKVIAYAKRNELEALAHRALVELFCQSQDRFKARAALAAMEAAFPEHAYTAAARQAVAALPPRTPRPS